VIVKLEVAPSRMTTWKRFEIDGYWFSVTSNVRTRAGAAIATIAVRTA
jgi:hypothetical protein